MTPPDVPGMAERGLGWVAAGLVLDVEVESIFVVAKDAIGGKEGKEMVSGTLSGRSRCWSYRTKVKEMSKILEKFEPPMSKQNIYTAVEQKIEEEKGKKKSKMYHEIISLA